MNPWETSFMSGAKPKPKISRRTFFSFHYQYDVSRAQIVRNSWVTKEDREDAGFFDASVFESKQRESEETLKRFLTEALGGSTVTCVLIGSQTAFRPWVRYEIVRSFQRGNGLFGVRVNNIKNLKGQFGNVGLSPFDHIAYQVVGDRVCWKECDAAGNWSAYDKVPSMALSEVAYNLNNQYHHTFGRFPIYDWVNDKGYENIGIWIQNAAEAAGK